MVLKDCDLLLRVVTGRACLVDSSFGKRGPGVEEREGAAEPSRSDELGADMMEASKS